MIADYVILSGNVVTNVVVIDSADTATLIALKAVGPVVGVAIGATTSDGGKTFTNPANATPPDPNLVAVNAWLATAPNAITSPPVNVLQAVVKLAAGQ